MDTMRLQLEGPVARLTLDRPRVLNAGNRRWVADLNEAVRRLAERPEARVVVITGAGRAFSTGVDLTEQLPPADPNAPLPESLPPLDPCAAGCI